MSKDPSLLRSTNSQHTIRPRISRLQWGFIRKYQALLALQIWQTRACQKSFNRTMWMAFSPFHRTKFQTGLREEARQDVRGIVLPMTSCRGEVSDFWLAFITFCSTSISSRTVLDPQSRIPVMTIGKIFRYCCNFRS